MKQNPLNTMPNNEWEYVTQDFLGTEKSGKEA